MTQTTDTIGERHERYSPHPIMSGETAAAPALAPETILLHVAQVCVPDRFCKSLQQDADFQRLEFRCHQIAFLKDFAESHSRNLRIRARRRFTDRNRIGKLLFIREQRDHTLLRGLINHTSQTRYGIFIVPTLPSIPNVLRTGVAIAARPLGPETHVFLPHGGDITRVGSFVKKMEQAPCISYRAIVGRFKRSIRVTIGRSPCQHEVVGMSGVEWCNGTMFQDLAIMVYAHNFTVARSSFSSVALHLSPFRKTRL
jgi:hypothetical protein